MESDGFKIMNIYQYENTLTKYDSKGFFSNSTEKKLENFHIELMLAEKEELKIRGKESR